MRDQDTRRRFDLIEPKWATFKIAIVEGIVATAVTMVATVVAVAIGLDAPAGRVWLLFVPAPVVGVAWGVRVVRSAWRLLDPEQRRRLIHQRDLIQQQESLAAQRASATADYQAIQLRIRELSELTDKMKRLDPSAYQARIATLERASLLLRQRAQLNEQLISGYDRAAAELDIEIDSLDAMANVTDGTEGEIELKLAELNIVREQILDQIMENERRLAADVEVASLLRAS
jgi:hypothetical protein